MNLDRGNQEEYVNASCYWGDDPWQNWMEERIHVNDPKTLGKRFSCYFFVEYKKKFSYKRLSLTFMPQFPNAYETLMLPLFFWSRFTTHTQTT